MTDYPLKYGPNPLNIGLSPSTLEHFSGSCNVEGGSVTPQHWSEALNTGAKPGPEGGGVRTVRKFGALSEIRRNVLTIGERGA